MVVKDIGMSNNISKLIEIEKSKRSLNSGKKIPTIKIVNEIAEFCKVSYNSIESYRKGYSVPSLPIAFRLAEFFRISIEEIFSVTDYDLAVTGKNKRGRKPNPVSHCTHGECRDNLFAKGLCRRHYQQMRNGKIKIDK